MRKYPDFIELPQKAPKELKEYHDSLASWWSQVKILLNDLDTKAHQGSAGKEPWVVTGVSVTHQMAVTSATDLYTANRLGVLLQDLKNKGIIS
tara:strand:- start:25 stop:303 length:279 start_codon:yes stop_codon:yes gene_type:complete